MFSYLEWIILLTPLYDVTKQWSQLQILPNVILLWYLSDFVPATNFYSIVTNLKCSILKDYLYCTLERQLSQRNLKVLTTWLPMSDGVKKYRRKGKVKKFLPQYVRASYLYAWILYWQKTSDGSSWQLQ